MTVHEIAVGLKTLEPNLFEAGTKGSYGLYQLHMTFSDDWDGFTKKISFFPAKRAAPVVVNITTDTVDIPPEATANSGICNFIISGVATGMAAITLPGTLTVDETKVPATTPAGSPTPTEITQIYLSILGSERLPIPDATGYWKLYNYTTEEYEVSEYPTAGATPVKGVDYDDGADGVRGSRINKGTAITGTTATGTVFSGSGITDALINDMYINSTTFNVYNCTLGGIASVAKWAYIGTTKGADGNGIVSVIRTSGTGAAGTTDTYTITFTDTTTTTFTVTHGTDGITPVKDTDYFDGTDGKGITSITRTSGDGSAGTTDTYTITFTDATTTTFTVVNGADGTGTGDMLKSTYDPDEDGIISADIIADGTTNKAYTATEKTKLSGIAAGATAVTVDTTIADSGANPVTGNAVFDALALKLDKAGGTMTGDVVGHADTDYTTARFRNVTLSTSAASGGSNGDIWILYTA